MPHRAPDWVPDHAIYFITICTTPRGINQLTKEDVASWIYESMVYRETRQAWWIHLVLLMPDHLHALMTFSKELEMKHTISQWKRYVARQKKIKWQRDYFEHRLRKSESYDEKAHYIRMNPVRAGLTEKMEHWPFVWSKQVQAV
jgi:putative transposase